MKNCIYAQNVKLEFNVNLSLALLGVTSLCDPTSVCKITMEYIISLLSLLTLSAE